MKLNIKRIITFCTLSVLVLSCSSSKKDNSIQEKLFGAETEFVENLISNVKPVWFSGSEKYRLHTPSGEIAPHFFYDIKPELSVKHEKVNFVITTLEGSPYEYGLDIVSGQRYAVGPYCDQTDVWEEYQGIISTPPFTMGIVPRVLDQLGGPQQIIVFGGKEFYKENYTRNFYDAYVIGGVIEQICPSGNCPKVGDWDSRLILIGISKFSSKFDKVRTLADLKKIIEWKQVKAFLENGRGRNRIVNNQFPAYRVETEVSTQKALKYISNKSTIFSNRKLLAVRNSCHQLYEYLWNYLGVPSRFEKEIRKLKTVKQRYSYLRKNRADRNDLFYRRFIKSFRKYHDKLQTCSKYIYPASMLNNPDRVWLFAHLNAINYLHDLGYVFSCRQELWVENPVLFSGKRYIQASQSFRRCDAKRVDMAFEQAPEFLNKLRSKNNLSYRFIDYDRKAFGSHEKLYSWVKTRNKEKKCEKGSEFYERKMETFPSNIKWKNRSFGISMGRGEYY